MMAAKRIPAKPEIEVVTDRAKVAEEKQKPLITFTTGIGETFHVKIKQPSGRAVLIAVHL
jgi:hypothetical protein